MRHAFLLVAVVASTTYANGQTSAQNQLTAAMEELRPLCAQEEATDRAEAKSLRAPASAAVTRALATEAAFWTFLTNPATPYLDRMMAAQHGAGVTSVQRLPRLWKTAAELQSVPIGVYPSPCNFLRSAQFNPTWWTKRRDRSLGATAPRPASRLIAGHTISLSLEAVDYPLTLDARASAPWLWQMTRAFSILMPGVRKHFAAPGRYAAMAEAAWNWAPGDGYESSERLEALRTGPRNADWVKVMVRLALEGRPQPESTVLLDLHVFGNDSYHLEELVHAAQIVILQRTDRRDVAANASYQAVQTATTSYASFSKVLKPIRTATATLAIARWATKPGLEERHRYGFASNVCRMVEDAPFTPNPEILNSSKGFAAEMTSSLAAFEKWFAAARPRLEQRANVERARWDAVAGELGRKLE